MQTLYSIEAGACPADISRAQEELSKKMEQSSRLFAYLLFLISEVAKYAETDALKRAAKHLPSQEDLQVNTKLSGNELMSRYCQDPSFQQQASRGHFQAHLDMALVKTCYLALCATPEYAGYISTPERDKNSERDILMHIFNNILLPDERVDEHLSEQFLVWDDDAEMMQTMVIHFLQRPAGWDFEQVISDEKRDFGQELLKTTLDKKEHCLEVIGSKLQNWDADRIALLDMVLMRMGLCELLYFETIPPKVTLNEYIDLAKDYSTAQSGQFVNGILDGIHKEMEAEGRLRKVEYRK